MIDTMFCKICNKIVEKESIWHADENSCAECKQYCIEKQDNGEVFEYLDVGPFSLEFQTKTKSAVILCFLDDQRDILRSFLMEELTVSLAQEWLALLKIYGMFS
jgi:hypothetical protein